MMLLKCCTQYVSKLENSTVTTGLEKGQFSFQSQRKAMPKNDQTTISLARKVMLKVLQARHQQYRNLELLNVQAGFKKRQTKRRSNCKHSLDHGGGKGIPEKDQVLLH